MTTITPNLITSRQCCINCTGFLFVNELTTTLHVLCTNHSWVRHLHT